MVEQEEKRWLRALLEGEVEPGSEEWEQVCTDSAFTRVREKVGAVARLDFTQQEDEVEGMWGVLVDRRKKGLERRARGRKRLLRWISGTAAVVALGIGGWLSIRGVEREQVVVVGGRTVEGRTELVLPNGERRVLGDGKVRVVSDSCGEMRTENRTLIVELGGQETKKAEYYTLNVPYGEKYSIVLPDGTKVFLNAASELKYPVEFMGDRRVVDLDGEAYFEVHKDNQRPFVVRTKGAEVCVLGTSFNVNTYGDDGRIYTTLVNGSVRVLSVKNGQEKVLTPGMQGVMNMQTGQLMVREVDVESYVAWREGRFVFRTMTLDLIMQQLQRWYDFEVFYQNLELKDYEFRGVIKRDMDLDKVLSVIKATTNVDFEVKGKVITIIKR